MHKHLQNLERLCRKWEFRYGPYDELVIEVKHEIEANKTKPLSSYPTANQGQYWESKEEFSAPMH